MWEVISITNKKKKHISPSKIGEVTVDWEQAMYSPDPYHNSERDF